ncbi:MAG: outer membrane protein transport protein [Mariprofundaceae bacterium]
MRRVLFLFSVFMLFSTQVFASGFAVKDQGTKAMGMANAFVAVADDASAAWYNPAALAFQPGTSITAGGQYVIPSVDYTGGSGNGSMDKENFLIPFAYLSYNSDALPVALGLAINSPFGLSSDWTNSTTTFVGALGATTFSEIKAINFNPVAAFKVNENLSIAIGGSYYLVTDVAFDTSVAVQHGDGDGFGGTAAVFYTSDAFNVGVTYRSRVKVDVEGTTTVGANSTAATTSVTFPDMISAGFAFHPADNWLLSFQYDWVNWKTFDELKFDYAANIGLGTSITIPENWKASNSFSVGAEWEYNSKMRARFGYAYDQTPVSDVEFTPRIVDNDRHFFTIGYGYSISDNTVIDVAYGYIRVNDRTQTASVGANAGRNGTYEADLHIVSASFSHRF